MLFERAEWKSGVRMLDYDREKGRGVESNSKLRGNGD